MSDTDPIESSLARSVAAEFRYLHITFGHHAHELVIPVRIDDGNDEDQLLIEVADAHAPCPADRIPVLGIGIDHGAVEVTVWDRHGDARQAWHERSDS
jgi:hypothetical protein